MDQRKVLLSSLETVIFSHMTPKEQTKKHTVNFTHFNCSEISFVKSYALTVNPKGIVTKSVVKEM